jgi:LuxR family maltose regulon positive regulatory protein
LAESIADALADIGPDPAARARFVLVLDDADRVSSVVLGAAVRDVLGWLPDGSQVAIGSRREPSLGLGRLRAQRTILELGAADLAMSVPEAALLLTNDGLELELSAVQSLVKRTEGWPVALELAAASWSASTTDRRRQPRGDDHFFADYFRTELLGELAPAAQRFLVDSAVLDRLSGPVCDDVLRCSGSARLLSELALGTVPLVAVDAGHETYRVHGMFREMLDSELRRTDAERRTDLHRRAAAWYRRAGDPDRSIGHTCRAGDLDGTAELLWARLPRYLSRGQNRLVQRWLSGITLERAPGSAAAALVAAHSHLAMGRVGVAEQWARTAGVALDHLPDGEITDGRAGMLIIEAWLARSGARGMAAASARAYDLLRDDSPWRASCCFLRGTAALLSGDRGRAEQLLEEGATRGAGLAPDAASLCLAQLAVVAGERGELEAASDFAQRALSTLQAHGLDEYPGSALVFAVHAAASLRADRADDAKVELARCLRGLGSLDDSLCWYGAEVRILAARVSLALGDVTEARDLLAEASRLGRRTRDIVIFGDWFAEAWDQFDARAETALAGSASLTTAELRILRLLPTHYSFHEIAGRLHVSSNTVKTHVHAVYRKLDASSRSEAVAHAARAGLLGG